MKTLRATVALATLVALAGCSSGASEIGARDFVNSIGDDMKICNVRDLGPKLAPEFAATNEAIPALHSPAGRMNRDEMFGAFSQTCNNQQGRVYKSTTGDVKVAADGKTATAEVTVDSTFTDGGHVIEKTSRQTYTVALRGDKYQLVGLNSRTTGLFVDGKQVY